MIDWLRVNELKTEVGAEDFRDLVEIFFEELDDVTERLAATAPDDIGEDDIHFLKGCALNLGFREVSRLCHVLEEKAGAGGLAAGEVATLLTACQASKTAFAADEALAA